jgi:hypothetical protein
VRQLLGVVELQCRQQLATFGRPHVHARRQRQHAVVLGQHVARGAPQPRQGLAQVGAAARLVPAGPQQRRQARARRGAFEMQPGEQGRLARGKRDLGAVVERQRGRTVQAQGGHGVATVAA